MIEEAIEIVEEKLQYKTVECEQLRTKLEDVNQQNIKFIQNVRKLFMFN